MTSVWDWGTPALKEHPRVLTHSVNCSSWLSIHNLLIYSLIHSKTCHALINASLILFLVSMVTHSFPHSFVHCGYSAPCSCELCPCCSLTHSACAHPRSVLSLIFMSVRCLCRCIFHRSCLFIRHEFVYSSNPFIFIIANID